MATWKRVAIYYLSGFVILTFHDPAKNHRAMWEYL